MRTIPLLAALPALALAACGDAAVEIPAQLTVVNIAPHHGASNVATDVSVEISFSDQLRRDTIDAQSVRLEQDGDAVDVERSFEARQHQVTLLPDTDLEPDTEYEIYIGEEVSGEEAGALGTEIRTRFRTSP